MNNMPQRIITVDVKVRLTLVVAYDSDAQEAIDDTIENMDYSFTHHNADPGVTIKDTEILEVIEWRE